MMNDQTSPESESDSDETAESDEDKPNWSLANWSIILLFTALTMVGIALSVGWLESVVAVPETSTDSNAVTVPLFVYLYAGFGALGYVFTKLMNQIEAYDEWSELEHLVEMAVRIPAAMILAAGIHLFIGEFGQTTGTTGARFAAGVAFLVGLYVNVALKALGSLADRILGRSSKSTDS